MTAGLLRSSSRLPSRRWLVSNVLAQLAFGLLAMTICLPSMQEWGAIFGSSQAAVQLTFSGYVVAYGSLQLLYGPLSDRLGRKRVLMLGLALAFAGSVMAALAPDLPTLVLARVLQGAGGAACMVIGRALVQDLFAGPERTRIMAYVGVAMGLCPPLATIVGGQLHVRMGWPSTFVVMAVLAVLLFIAAWRGLPGHTPRTELQPHWLTAMWGGYARLLREPAFVLHLCILAMTTATFYTFLGGAPLVLGSVGVKPDGIGFYIMCVPGSYVVGNLLAARLALEARPVRMMRWGQALTLSGITLVLLLAYAGWRSPLAFVLPLTLLGLGHGLLVPPLLAGTVGLLPALAGAAAGVAGLSQQLTGAFGGLAVGLFSHDGARNLGWLMLGFALCGAWAQWNLHRREKP